jgi:hypothetical protein
MHVPSSSLPLTNAEKQYLDGSRQFTKAQQRYMRCRLRKKLSLLNDESCNVAAALRERSNAAATIDLRNYNKNSAGSGNFVPFTGSSNPRVLSDMGLAIPRPTRLGDPRSVIRGSHSNIILTSLNFSSSTRSLETLQFFHVLAEFCKWTCSIKDARSSLATSSIFF